VCFHYTSVEKYLLQGGLYTEPFYAIIPTLFSSFLPFRYPYMLLHYLTFFTLDYSYIYFNITWHDVSTMHSRYNRQCNLEVSFPLVTYAVDNILLVWDQCSVYLTKML